MHSPKCFLPYAYRYLWLLLCLAGASIDEHVCSSTPEATGCPAVAAAAGNSLLQLASKPSRNRAVTDIPSDEEDLPTDKESSIRPVQDGKPNSPPPSSLAAMFDGGVTTKTPAVAEAKKVAATSKPLVTKDMLEVAMVRSALMQKLQQIRSSVYLVYQTRGVLSISIFAIICLIGVFILCTIMNLQDSRREPSSRLGGSNSPAARLLARYGDGSGHSSPPGRPSSSRTSPPLSNVVLSAGMTSSSSAPTLCPGLVVPANSDCVLVIRMLAPKIQVGAADIGDAAAGGPAVHAGQGEMELGIFDLVGKPVLSASIVQPWPKQGDTVVTIRTVNAPHSAAAGWLTLCRAGDSHNSMLIYDKDGAIFGTIAKDASQPQYALNSNTGERLLLFEGAFEEHSINVLDARQSMIAHVEPCKMAFETDGRFYQARIAAGVDVGLVLSGLLSIDAMEAR